MEKYQYTKHEKVNAATDLATMLEQPQIEWNKMHSLTEGQHLGALTQGSLGKRIQAHLDEAGAELAIALGIEPVNNVKKLTAAIRKRNCKAKPVETFRSLLGNYDIERQDDSRKETDHGRVTAFQFTKDEKLAASENLSWLLLTLEVHCEKSKIQEFSPSETNPDLTTLVNKLDDLSKAYIEVLEQGHLGAVIQTFLTDAGDSLGEALQTGPVNNIRDLSRAMTKKIYQDIPVAVLKNILDQYATKRTWGKMNQTRHNVQALEFSKTQKVHAAKTLSWLIVIMSMFKDRETMQKLEGDQLNSLLNTLDLLDGKDYMGPLNSGLSGQRGKVLPTIAGDSLGDALGTTGPLSTIQELAAAMRKKVYQDNPAVVFYKLLHDYADQREGDNLPETKLIGADKFQFTRQQKVDAARDLAITLNRLNQYRDTIPELTQDKLAKMLLYTLNIMNDGKWDAPLAQGKLGVLVKSFLTIAGDRLGETLKTTGPLGTIQELLAAMQTRCTRMLLLQFSAGFWMTM